MTHYLPIRFLVRDYAVGYDVREWLFFQARGCSCLDLDGKGGHSSGGADVPPNERSLELIEPSDVIRLGALAKQDRDDFFARNHRWRVYADRVVCVALCQGAALHFLDGKVGVKDFDVWTFFAQHPDGRLRAERRVGHGDFGPSKFGRHPADKGYEGRRIDFMMRSIDCPPNTDAVQAIRDYLSSGATDSARALAKKAVVLIEPGHLCGRVVWPA